MGTRRSAVQWQALVDSFHDSGLSAPQFCEQESIAYASFMNWKKRLLCDSQNKEVNVPLGPSFVELTQEVEPAPSWHIELDLAPGIQLRIARPA